MGDTARGATGKAMSYIMGDVQARNTATEEERAQFEAERQRIAQLEAPGEELAFELVPAPGRLVLEPIKEEEVTASGIFIDSANKQKPNEALVIAVGPGVTEWLPGDRVLHARYVGSEVTNGKVKQLVVESKHILAKVVAINDAQQTSSNGEGRCCN